MTENKGGRVIVATLILYLFVISSGLQMGAAIYESFVITPLWSGSLPRSVTEWNLIRAYAIEPAEYWQRGTPLYSLSAVLMLSAAWIMPVPRRRLALTAGVLAVLVVVSTRMFFIPILSQTIFTNGAGLSGAEITELATRWVHWNWLRLAAGFVAWCVAIRALSLSSLRDLQGVRSQPYTAAEPDRNFVVLN